MMIEYRAVWERANGPIPEGMFVCHRCDNPRCVNVDHLFLGTAFDNNHDMIAKGRQHRAPDVCPKGHSEFSVTKRGHRRCQECNRQAARRRRSHVSAEA
jgi:hypothetical protein